MKTKIFGAIIGLTLLLGSPITLLSLMDSYNSQIVQKAEIETSLQSTSFIEIDFPTQDGNIRLLKINLRDLRNNSNHLRNFYRPNSNFLISVLSKNINRTICKRICTIHSSKSVPLFIRLCKLVV